MIVKWDLSVQGQYFYEYQTMEAVETGQRRDKAMVFIHALLMGFQGHQIGCCGKRDADLWSTQQDLSYVLVSKIRPLTQPVNPDSSISEALSLCPPTPQPSTKN